MLEFMAVGCVAKVDNFYGVVGIVLPCKFFAHEVYTVAVPMISTQLASAAVWCKNGYQPRLI